MDDDNCILQGERQSSIRITEIMKDTTIRLEAAKLGEDKVKLAKRQYRGQGRYIDEILEQRDDRCMKKISKDGLLLCKLQAEVFENSIDKMDPSQAIEHKCI